MDKKKELINKIAYGCFYAGIIIEVLIVIIDKSSYTNPIEGQLFRLTFLLFLIKLCLTKYTLKEYITIFLFGILGGISYFATGRNEVIRLVVMIAACKEIDMQKCLKYIFYMTLAGCTAIVLLSVTGVYGAASLTQDYGRGSVETRYTLGMGHPNALHCMVWALTTLYLYLYGKGTKWYGYILLFLINVGFFLLTDSKTSLIVSVFVILLAVFSSGKMLLAFQKISGIASIVITVFSIGISVMIAGNAYRVYNYVWYIDRSSIAAFYSKINDILNGRIRILVENDNFEGTIQTWRVFSKPENNYFFDMGWIRMFYWYGIIPGAVFVIVLLIVMIYCYRKKQYMALMLITSFSVYTIIEAHAISEYLARNYVFFLLGMYWNKALHLEAEREWNILELIVYFVLGKE